MPDSQSRPDRRESDPVVSGGGANPSQTDHDSLPTVGAAADVEPPTSALFGAQLEPVLHQACGGRLSPVRWFRTDWQHGGALTGYLYLKRAWRLGEFYRELRWKIRRRKFKVMSSNDPDDWVN